MSITIKSNHKRGFTIVELLIVIVVIAILVAISIVAYNGIQQRAQNGKTQTALTSWLKGLALYKTDAGDWPTDWACLGEGYKYNASGQDATGVGQCRRDGTSWSMTEATVFNEKMKPYLGSVLPTPAFVTRVANDTTWLRGLAYAGSGGDGKDVYISAIYAGVLSSCPDAAGIYASPSPLNGNTLCTYSLGRRP